MQYLRVIEFHKDGYPHIHAILQFPSANIRVTNSKWFSKTLYKHWKAQWKSGHSDYQQPNKSGVGIILYLLKYLLKNQTKKTLFKKLIQSHNEKQSDALASHGVPMASSIKKRPPTHIQNVKLCTWSRLFDFKPFYIIKTK